MANASVVHNLVKTVTTAGARVAISSTKVMANWLLVQPKNDNTDIIYLGDSAVTSTNGAELSVGQSDVLWPSATTNIYDLSTIYIDAAVSGEGVKVLYTSF